MKVQRHWVLLFISQISSISAQSFPSPVGSGCLSAEQCTPNSDCVQNQCLCKPGFTLLASLECKMDFGGSCAQPRDCNTAMGLHCINSICSCSPSLGEEYLFELGSCMNSSMRGMFTEVAGLINQTQFELMRFATLFNIYMIQSNTPPEGSNDIDGVLAGSDINPVVYQRLEQLERQIFSEQSPIPKIVSPPPTPATGNSAQIESPRTTTSTPTVPTPFSLQNFLDSQNLFKRQTATNPPAGVSVSISRPILPTSPPVAVTTPPLTQAPPVSPFGNLSGNGGGLAAIIPNFIRMFTQFLPFLQGFNNVLSTAILTPLQNLRNANMQTQQNPQNPPAGNIFSGIGGLLSRLNLGLSPSPPQDGVVVNAGADPGLGVGVNVNVNPDRVRQNLLSLPLRLLQIPGRIFNSFFGPNSAFVQLRSAVLPNVDFNRRAFQFFPWPLG